MIFYSYLYSYFCVYFYFILLLLECYFYVYFLLFTLLHFLTSIRIYFSKINGKKHKGKTFHEIIQQDPNYVTFFRTQVPHVSTEAFRLCQFAAWIKHVNLNLPIANFTNIWAPLREQHQTHMKLYQICQCTCQGQHCPLGSQNRQTNCGHTPAKKGNGIFYHSSAYCFQD